MKARDADCAGRPLDGFDGAGVGDVDGGVVGVFGDDGDDDNDGGSHARRRRKVAMCAWMSRSHFARVMNRSFVVRV